MTRDVRTDPSFSSAAADAASDADRRRFARHPGLHWYDRDPVKGEMPAWALRGVVAIRVLQLRPGVRFRMPVYADGSVGCDPEIIRRAAEVFGRMGGT